jgi:hypothetical protein
MFPVAHLRTLYKAHPCIDWRGQTCRQTAGGGAKEDKQEHSLKLFLVDVWEVSYLMYVCGAGFPRQAAHSGCPAQTQRLAGGSALI